MYKRIIIIISILTFIILVFVGTIMFLAIRDGNKVLNYSDFANLETQEITKNNIKYLLVSGQYIGSTLNIKEIKEERINGDIIVRVYTTLKRLDSSTLFYPVRLNDSVKRVLFGNEKKIIWEKLN